MHQFDRTVRSAGAVPDDGCAVCGGSAARRLTNTANRKSVPSTSGGTLTGAAARQPNPQKEYTKTNLKRRRKHFLLRSVFYFCILFFAGCNSVFILHRTSVDILCGRSVQNPAHAFVGHRLAARILRLDGDRRSGAAALFKALHDLENVKRLLPAFRGSRPVRRALAMSARPRAREFSA